MWMFYDLEMIIASNTYVKKYIVYFLAKKDLHMGIITVAFIKHETTRIPHSCGKSLNV